MAANGRINSYGGAFFFFPPLSLWATRGGVFTTPVGQGCGDESRLFYLRHRMSCFETIIPNRTSVMQASQQRIALQKNVNVFFTSPSPMTGETIVRVHTHTWDFRWGWGEERGARRKPAPSFLGETFLRQWCQLRKGINGALEGVQTWTCMAASAEPWHSTYRTHACWHRHKSLTAGKAAQAARLRIRAPRDGNGGDEAAPLSVTCRKKMYITIHDLHIAKREG